LSLLINPTLAQTTMIQRFASFKTGTVF